MFEPTATYIQQHWAWLLTMTVSVLCTGCSIGYAWYVGNRGRDKVVAWRRVVFTRLVAKQIHDKATAIKMSFHGEEIENVRLAQFEFKNISSHPIVESDFISPIEIAFPEAKAILDSQVTDCSPAHLKATAKFEGTTVAVNILVLNRGDSLNVRTLLTTDEFVNYKVSALIAGGRVTESEARFSGRVFDRAITLLFVCVSTLMLTAFYIGGWSVDRRTFLPITLVTMIYGIIVGVGLLRIAMKIRTRAMQAHS